MVSLFLILKIENWISSAKKARFSAFSRRSDLVFMYTPTHISKVDYDSWRYKIKILSGENFPFGMTTKMEFITLEDGKTPFLNFRLS